MVRQPFAAIPAHRTLQERLRPVLLVALLGLISGFVAASEHEALVAELDALLEPWQAPSGPGLVVAVSRRGEMVLTRSYGAAYIEQQVPNTDATRFNAGSLAKSLTAYAILKLEAEGRLSLSDRLEDHLQDLPAPMRRLTIEQLLHHTSGLKDDWTLANLAGWESSDVRTHEQTRRLLLRQRDLEFDPGSAFAYTNSGYILLADVISAVTEAPYPYWMRQEVFLPLRMFSTMVPASPREPISALATPYEVQRGATPGHDLQRGIVQSDVQGASNLVTTVEDMLRWGDHLLRASLNDESLLARMQQSGRLADGTATGYGLGFQIGRLGARDVLQHGGALSGYRSHLLIVPEAELVVVILANINDVRPGALATELAQLVLDGNRASAAAAADDGGNGRQAERELDNVDRYRGRYLLDTGMTLNIEAGDEQLYLVMDGAMQWLRPTGRNRFELARQGLELRFQKNGRGPATGLVLMLPDGRLTGKRVEPRELTSWDLELLRGRYFSAALDVYFELAGDNKRLQVRRSRGADLELLRITDDVFLEQQPGNLVLELKRNRRGRVTGFVLSSPRASNIEFVRE